MSDPTETIPDGRAPKELRAAFDRHVEERAEGGSGAAADVARRLLTCTTALPPAVSDVLELPPGSSYALGAEQVQLGRDTAAAEDARGAAWAAWRNVAVRSAAHRATRRDTPQTVAGLVPWRP